MGQYDLERVVRAMLGAPRNIQKSAQYSSFLQDIDTQKVTQDLSNLQDSKTPR